MTPYYYIIIEKPDLVPLKMITLRWKPPHADILLVAFMTLLGLVGAQWLADCAFIQPPTFSHTNIRFLNVTFIILFISFREAP